MWKKKQQKTTLYQKKQYVTSAWLCSICKDQTFHQGFLELLANSWLAKSAPKAPLNHPNFTDGQADLK